MCENIPLMMLVDGGTRFLGGLHHIKKKLFCNTKKGNQIIGKSSIKKTKVDRLKVTDVIVAYRRPFYWHFFANCNCRPALELYFRTLEGVSSHQSPTTLASQRSQSRLLSRWVTLIVSLLSYQYRIPR